MKHLILAACLAATPAIAHDQWADGSEVPIWVKSACCGPQDVHHLRPEQIHLMRDGWHIDGIRTVVPVERALPSPDGSTWAFWNPVGEPEPTVFCLFVPFQGL